MQNDTMLGRDETTAVAAGRYTESAVWMHWITAILIAIILPLAWIMTSLPENDPSAGFYYSLHKSVGITIFVVVVLRLLWRAVRHAPDMPRDVPPWAALAARVDHWLLYAILIIMPVSGYLLSVAGGYPVSFFGLFDLPGMAKNETLQSTAETIHVIGRFFVYAFILLHLLGAIWHVAIRRDGVLERMLPRQRRHYDRP